MKIAILILAIAAVALLPSLANLPIAKIQAQQAQTNESSFATLKTAQNPDHIVILVSRNGAPPIDKPIVVIPPTKENENGTVIVPGENNTSQNITAGNPGNITIIKPDGNVTEVPAGNVTNDGNVTVIAPPDQDVTQTPGNVTIVDPPPVITHPIVLPPSQNCTCQQQNQTILVKPGQPPIAQNANDTKPPMFPNSTKP